MDHPALEWIKTAKGTWYDKFTSLLEEYDRAPRASEFDVFSKRWPISVNGTRDWNALNVMKDALSRMPVVDDIKVYVIPGETREVLGYNGFAGAYDPHSGREMILLFTPVRAQTVTHEFAHKRFAVLGREFEREWAGLNSYLYGSKVIFHERFGTPMWKDRMIDGAKWGFWKPYANETEYEDVAVLTSAIRHKPAIQDRNAYSIYLLQFSTMNENCVGILEKKVALLQQGRFIHPQEAANIKRELQILPEIARSMSGSLLFYPDSFFERLQRDYNLK